MYERPKTYPLNSATATEESSPALLPRSIQEQGGKNVERHSEILRLVVTLEEALLGHAAPWPETTSETPTGMLPIILSGLLYEGALAGEILERLRRISNELGI